MPLLHLGLLYGGQSSEHDISVLSARSVFDALDRSRYRVTPLFIARDGAWYAVGDEALPDDGAHGRRVSMQPGAGLSTDDGPLDVDVVIPMLHGQNGEDGRIQGVLETLGLAYVGAGVLASAVCMDKDVAKRLLRDAGLPVVDAVVVRRGAARPSWTDLTHTLGEVLFVKPAGSGSSVGVTRVDRAEALDPALDLALRYDHKVLVERAMTGAREIEVAVLGNLFDDEARAPRASVPGEIVSTATFYDYDAKYLDADAARMDVPADLPSDLANRVRSLALDAYRALGCEGLARVDFFVMPDGGAFVNEINTLPGFTARSMYPVMFEASDLPLPALLDTLIALARTRHARQQALSTAR